MKKNKISRKEFISKTSKVVGGIVLCPAVLTMLQSCNNNSSGPSEISDCPNTCSEVDNNLLAMCSEHGAQFDTNGCPVSGPATEPLHSYCYDFNEGILTIENSLTINISDYPELIIGVAISLNDENVNQINDKGLLIYRKTETEFNVLSRVCSHNQKLVLPFDS